MGLGFRSSGRNDGWDTEGASWAVTCKSDPRFDGSGNCSGLFSSAPQDHIRAVATRLGIEPPPDVEVSIVKY